jgi:hypothetical protein
MKTLLDSITNLYSSRGGGVVIALASRSKFAQEGPVPKQTSQPVGLWLAGVRIPSPAPFFYRDFFLDVETSSHTYFGAKQVRRLFARFMETREYLGIEAETVIEK